MSHFKTLVFTKTDEDYEIFEALAPYDENIENNDKAKWDWWTFGGRFGYELQLKTKDEDGEYECANCAKFNELLTENETDAARLAEFWDGYVEGNGDPEKYKAELYKPEYYSEQYGTKERFIRICADPLMPFAFVDPEGVWHEQGTMRWFGLSDSTPVSIDAYTDEWLRMCERAQKEDLYVTIVDCHI